MEWKNVKHLKVCYVLPKRLSEIPHQLTPPPAAWICQLCTPANKGGTVILNLYQRSWAVGKREIACHWCFHLYLLITMKQRLNIFYRFVTVICFVLVNRHLHCLLTVLICYSCFPYYFVKTYNVVVNSTTTVQWYVTLQ